ncbi:MAG: O-unit flippase-like protein [Paludibacter sp.]|nr:O-unit flippase-like protein [Paludibacter sp.]
MQIGRKDVIWNFAATFMRVASGIIVLPLVLRILPRQEYGLWTIYVTIGGLATLLDFGFANSFTRNVTYIFSGVKELKKEGYTPVNNDNSIDYGLLKSVIAAMRRYYGILSIIFLGVFTIVSPFYLTQILKEYSGNKSEIWVSWFAYGVLVAYQLYTYYYSSILSGRGKVKRVQQIIIIGQVSRIGTAIIFLLLGYGIISLVIAQFVSDIVNRTLCYYSFYDKELKLNLHTSANIKVSEVMKLMTPNALKIGLTTMGGLLNSRLIILIAPLYLTLDQIASYGTTKQMIDLIISLGLLWFGTYYPKITLHRVNEDFEQIKRMYLKAKFSMVMVFFICGAGLIFIGPSLLTLIHSKTQLLPAFMTFVFLIVAFLETNHGLAAQMLLTKNEVPFAKASIISGLASVALLFISLKLTTIGIWGMILAPGIAQIVYQNWKWPYMVIKDLDIKFKDYFISAFTTIKQL